MIDAYVGNRDPMNNISVNFKHILWGLYISRGEGGLCDIKFIIRVNN